jgi:hypothetical protein
MNYVKMLLTTCHCYIDFGAEHVWIGFTVENSVVRIIEIIQNYNFAF